MDNIQSQDRSVTDKVESFDRIFLEKIQLATNVLIELGEDGVLNNSFETELFLFKDRIERALLLGEPGRPGDDGTAKVG